MTGTPASVPATSSPLWPPRPGSGKPGIDRYGMRMGSATSLATKPRPEPRTIATRGLRVPSRCVTAAVAGATAPLPHRRIPRRCPGEKLAQRPPVHGAKAEPGQIVLALRGQRADPADLDAHRAKVGEPAQRESGDRKRHRIEAPVERD